jgi:hypothetical protein
MVGAKSQPEESTICRLAGSISPFGKTLSCLEISYIKQIGVRGRAYGKGLAIDVEPAEGRRGRRVTDWTASGDPSVWRFRAGIRRILGIVDDIE